MKVNALHWVAFGLTFALMIVWQTTPLSAGAHAAFVSLGVDGDWAWPVCGLAAAWAIYFALKLSVALWRRTRTKPSDA